MPLETRLLEYELPEKLIAQEPLLLRSDSRMMVLHRETENIEHRKFSDVVDYLMPGDLLVVNDSRVFPARLFLRKETGANIELLFQKPMNESETVWEALARPGRRLKEGTPLFHESSASPFCRMDKKKENGLWDIEILTGPLIPFLDEHGITPLPPYVKKTLSDPDKYQTVYAENSGSAAAPTAGMHFTDELLDSLEEGGVRRTQVTLHIGIDTFRPIVAESVEDHDMHTEYYTVSDKAAMDVSETIRSGGRIVAVGTTSVRTLESWAAGRTRNEIMEDARGAGDFTDLFIYNKEQFCVLDAMITNFHLPRTTLLAMVCAFAGRDFILRAYREAIEREYRFFSFGDCMLIL